MNNTTSAYRRSSRLDERVCCVQREELPDQTSYAMAYVPFQQWYDDVYTIDKALCQGTLFPVLDLPFLMGGRCR